MRYYVIGVVLVRLFGLGIAALAVAGTIAALRRR